MLARLTREIPEGRLGYEPKWDGFRCLAFRDGDDVDLRSRHDRPLARYFPEVVAGLRSVQTPTFVADGELVPESREFDFAALMSRLHPAATRVSMLAAQQPASFVAFDLLAIGERSLLREPIERRREVLEDMIREGGPHLRITPITRDPKQARSWLDDFKGGGVDGVVAKPLDGAYEPGRRAMVKVKTVRTADCVVAGCRLLNGRNAVSSLLLGLYDSQGELRHVGVVTQFPAEMRRAMLEDLRGDAIPIEEHPWRAGFAIDRSPLGRLLGSASRWTPEMGLDWLPLASRRVVEVAFDQVDGTRFRHPARFVRWRPDRDPGSCSIEQIELDRAPIADILRLDAGHHRAEAAPGRAS
jgi:ATP-dependent DNA ligase